MRHGTATQLGWCHRGGSPQSRSCLGWIPILFFFPNVWHRKASWLDYAGLLRKMTIVEFERFKAAVQRLRAEIMGLDRRRQRITCMKWLMKATCNAMLPCFNMCLIEVSTYSCTLACVANVIRVLYLSLIHI